MLKTYLKTAWRNIVRTAGYSSPNILGLSIGMGVALLIGLWVYDQYSYDKFLPDYGRLYRVQRNFSANGDTLTFQSKSLKLADALRSQVPEIEGVAEADFSYNHGLMVGEKKLYCDHGDRCGQPACFLPVFFSTCGGIEGNDASRFDPERDRFECCCPGILCCWCLSAV